MMENILSLLDVLFRIASSNLYLGVEWFNMGNREMFLFDPDTVVLKDFGITGYSLEPKHLEGDYQYPQIPYSTIVSLQGVLIEGREEEDCGSMFSDFTMKCCFNVVRNCPIELKEISPSEWFQNLGKLSERIGGSDLDIDWKVW